ncbi:putative microtubule-associated protein [Helianthus annuus]|uniref:Microtubule-associated protein n=1 Tax=Helianthus annuus TaxID=4232 RepID=A0A251S1D6_HELAN|nr:microtubule-associated protein 70-5 [Helianthus annuus]KAF5760575.1 putative microtubule-associated protein [Helianthus annuus]KAJ0443420.1 putative microtubule-associated protein [Helianthus annuus]KAJ0682120.1 putative microtubule-associated protein [Helianthus annuus]KAJ0821735.1 putative microtubule-associated protein [Helianthus annuus]
MVGFEEYGQECFHVTQPDPVVLELNRLQNLLKEKDRELGFAHSEIKAMKAADVLKEKSLEEMGNMVEKLDNKIRNTENLLEQKNLDIKKLVTEKKEAVAAQFAAEATLRRVYANQKDDDSVPIDSIIAPLEADIRMYKHEIAVLQEDKKTLERHTKSKEAALLEAERILRSALERALIVEEVQNQNFELQRRIEICQEENKILEKTNRQKVLEVEKLSETIKELEEAILAGGAAANAIRDFKRQISELQEEKRTLERELARANVSANRVATTVANEWKDEKDKVMPVKQWLEERRLMQAEMQRLRDKLTISERTAKSEAQLKEKVKLRLKTLEDGLKQSSYGSPRVEKSTHLFGILSSNGGRKRSTSQPRGSSLGSRKPDVESETKQINGANKNLVRQGLWASRSKVVDRDEKENNEMIVENTSALKFDKFKDEDRKTTKSFAGDGDDVVSGFLYDKLQKEVISLRKFCEMKDTSLNAKDEENKVLMKKVENLVKALEQESKKWKREAATRDKNLTSIKTDEQKPVKNLNSSKSFRAAKAS